jgi:hypothetical protein
VRLRARGRIVGRRNVALTAGRARTVRVRVSRRGRRLIRRAAPVRTRLVVRLPGEARARVLRVRIVR